MLMPLPICVTSDSQAFVRSGMKVPLMTSKEERILGLDVFLELLRGFPGPLRMGSDSLPELLLSGVSKSNPSEYPEIEKHVPIFSGSSMALSAEKFLIGSRHPPLLFGASFKITPYTGLLLSLVIKTAFIFCHLVGTLPPSVKFMLLSPVQSGFSKKRMPGCLGPLSKPCCTSLISSDTCSKRDGLFLKSWALCLQDKVAALPSFQTNSSGVFWMPFPSASPA